jgi:hypothetical protein
LDFPGAFWIDWHQIGVHQLPQALLSAFRWRYLQSLGGRQPIAANSPQFHRRFNLSASGLVFGRQVEMHTRGSTDTRQHWSVVMLDGADINLEQVRSSFAWV